MSLDKHDRLAHRSGVSGPSLSLGGVIPHPERRFVRRGLDFSLEELCRGLSNCRPSSSCPGPFDRVNLSNKGHMGSVDSSLRSA